MSTGRPGPIEETQRAQLFARWEAVAVAHAQELATMTDERAREVIASLGAAEAWRERNDRWRFCLIGGVAVQRWGEPRFTQDVDLKRLTGFGAEEGCIDTVLATLRPRRPDVRRFALKHRVLLALVRSELRPLLELKGAGEALPKLEGLIGLVARRLRPGISR